MAPPLLQRSGSLGHYESLMTQTNTSFYALHSEGIKGGRSIMLFPVRAIACASVDGSLST